MALFCGRRPGERPKKRTLVQPGTGTIAAGDMQKSSDAQLREQRNRKKSPI
jgi:hypothetical protein